MTDFSVRVADEPFATNGMNIVTEVVHESCKPERKILVQLDLH